MQTAGDLAEGLEADLLQREARLRNLRSTVQHVIDDLERALSSGREWAGPAVEALEEQLRTRRRSLMAALDHLDAAAAVVRGWRLS